MLKNSIKLNRTPLVPTHSLLNYFVVEGLFLSYDAIPCAIYYLYCQLGPFVVGSERILLFKKRCNKARCPITSFKSHICDKKTGLGSFKPHTSL